MRRVRHRERCNEEVSRSSSFLGAMCWNAMQKYGSGAEIGPLLGWQGKGAEKKRRREEKGKRREEKKNNRAPFREANNYIYKLPINRLSGPILK